MKKLIFILLLNIIVTGSCYAKTWAFISLKDGVQLKATISVPNMESNHLTYFDTAGKRLKVRSENVSYIKVWNEESGQSASYTMRYTKYKQYNRSNDNYKLKGPVWLVERDRNKLITQYQMAATYNVDKKGKMKMTTLNYIYNLFERPGEEYPTLVYVQPFLKGYIDNYGKKYFKDCPAMIEQTMSKDFPYYEENILIRLYEKYCQ